MQWDRWTQATTPSGDASSERALGMESGGRGKGGVPWATSPLPSHSRGSAGRKLCISLVSAVEISYPLGAGSCSCGSPEGVPVMKPEGGRLKRSFWEWCNLGQHSVGSDTSDLVTTCSVVTAPLLAWWSQEREETKRKKKKEGSGIILKGKKKFPDFLCLSEAFSFSTLFEYTDLVSNRWRLCRCTLGSAHKIHC